MEKVAMGPYRPRSRASGAWTLVALVFVGYAVVASRLDRVSLIVVSVALLTLAIVWIVALLQPADPAPNRRSAHADVPFGAPVDAMISP
jgi:hypothetical protein